MIFVSMRELRAGSASLLDSQEEIVITRHGKPAGILAPVDEGAFEDTLKAIRQARMLRNMQGLRSEAKAKGLDKLKLKDVNRVIRSFRTRSKA